MITWKSELLSLPNRFLHIASNKGWGGSTGAPLIFGNLGLCKQVHDPLNQSKITSSWFPHLYDTIHFQAHRKKQFFLSRLQLKGWQKRNSLTNCFYCSSRMEIVSLFVHHKSLQVTISFFPLNCDLRVNQLLMMRNGISSAKKLQWNNENFQAIT